MEPTPPLGIEAKSNSPAFTTVCGATAPFESAECAGRGVAGDRDWLRLAAWRARRGECVRIKIERVDDGVAPGRGGEDEGADDGENGETF